MQSSMASAERRGAAAHCGASAPPYGRIRRRQIQAAHGHIDCCPVIGQGVIVARHCNLAAVGGNPLRVGSAPRSTPASSSHLPSAGCLGVSPSQPRCVPLLHGGSCGRAMQRMWCDGPRAQRRSECRRSSQATDFGGQDNRRPSHCRGTGSEPLALVDPFSP